MTNALTDAISSAESALTGRLTGDTSPLARLTDAALSDLIAQEPNSVDGVCYLAALLQALRQHRDAKRLLRAAATSVLSSPLSDSTVRVAALNRLSVMTASLGELQYASRWLTQAANDLPAPASPLLHARTYANLASVHAQLGDSQQATWAVQQARQWLGPEADGSPADELEVHSLLAAVDAALARSNRDQARLTEALAHFRLSNRATLTIPTVETYEGRNNREISALTARAALEFEAARSGRSQDRLEQLTSVLETIASKAAATLGADHPQTLAVVVDLACAEFETARGTGDRSRLESAIRTLGATARRTAECIGERHPLALSASKSHALAVAQLESASATTPAASPRPRSARARELALIGSHAVLQHRYRLLDLIGRGGMGEVWRARDESLGRHVAVKCLKPLGPSHDQSFTRVLRERFRREARVAAALQHRGVTVVHDFGESDGILYLVMELLEGRNLSQLLEDNRHHPLPVGDVVDIADQVAAALAYTHRQGTVHRDLKPANIMRLTDGTVKICDFGIARLGHDIGFTSRLTGTGIAMGTPHYMSPEQIGGSEVDQRSDLYSLGCVLYEIATGVPPFDLDDAWAILVGHRDTPPRPPRSHRAELPGYLEDIILDLLAKAPAHRPDASDVARRLHLAGQPTFVSAPSISPRRESAGRRLPSWTRGMTAGHRAVSAGAPTLTRDASPRLADWWIDRPITRFTQEPASEEPPGPSAAALNALAGRHNAGLSLGRLGRWAEAGEVHRAVAAERERLLGPDHPDTLASRYEVAFTLSRTGRPADALREYKHVARFRSLALGPDHPDTLAARQEMAYMLGQLGRHFDAHQVYTSVLAARERTMGADHPDTLRCRHNLAFNLSRLGRLEDSYRMACDVAAARARVLGPQHPDTLVTRHEVAYALGQLGRWTEALQTYHEVAEARAQALGADHPDTLAARYEVGISLGRLGRSAEALQLYRELIDDRTRVHGPAHPETLRARHGLGVNLGRLGRWEEALAEARDVCAIRERVLGPEHPDTLVSRREVAVGLGWLGRWSDALTEYRKVATARERVLGADHPDTLASRNDEAHCLEQLGRNAEAVELYRRVAALRQERRNQP